MRNRGKRSYLKSVRPDVFPIDIMYIIFAYVAPPSVGMINNSLTVIRESPNFRDILAVLLTGKNWHNLFKNYVIITAKHIFERQMHYGFKTSLGIFSQLISITDFTNNPNYKYVKAINYDWVCTVNNCLNGRYTIKNKYKNIEYSINFYINKLIIIVIYGEIGMVYQPISKTEFKYIYCARIQDGVATYILDIYYYLNPDHPDWKIINHVINTLNLFT